MFFSNAGIVFIHRYPGESLNQYYKKSENIIEKITIDNSKKYIITPNQAENIYNNAAKQTAISNLGCKYY